MPFRHQERRLGEVVLGGDRLKHVMVQEPLDGHERGGITGEPTLREGVELEDRQSHHAQFSITEADTIAEDRISCAR
jgi:hypothetical protein